MQKPWAWRENVLAPGRVVEYQAFCYQETWTILPKIQTWKILVEYICVGKIHYSTIMVHSVLFRWLLYKYNVEAAVKTLWAILQPRAASTHPHSVSSFLILISIHVLVVYSPYIYHFQSNCLPGLLNSSLNSSDSLRLNPLYSSWLLVTVADLSLFIIILTQSLQNTLVCLLFLNPGIEFIWSTHCV